MSLLSISDMAYDAGQFELILRVVFGQIGVVELFSVVVVQGVGVHVYAHGELMLVCQFLVHEGFEVEVDSLQVDQEVVGKFADPCLLGNVSFFVAEIAFVVTDQFS